MPETVPIKRIKQKMAPNGSNSKVLKSILKKPGEKSQGKSDRVSFKKDKPAKTSTKNSQKTDTSKRKPEKSGSKAKSQEEVEKRLRDAAKRARSKSAGKKQKEIEDTNAKKKN